MESLRKDKADVLSHVIWRFVILYAFACLRANSMACNSRISVELVNIDGVEIFRVEFLEKAAAMAAEPLVPSDFEASEPTKTMSPLDHLFIRTPWNVEDSASIFFRCSIIALYVMEIVS